MAMDLTAFEHSLEDASPPKGLRKALEALWQEASGDWDAAHKLAQDDTGTAGSWVHAYLHRVEGDASNAGYWYRRADKPHATVSLREEWRAIAQALLDER
jgi:hypothetical protein